MARLNKHTRGWVSTPVPESISASGKPEFLSAVSRPYPFLLCESYTVVLSQRSKSFPWGGDYETELQDPKVLSLKLHWCKRSVFSQISFVNLECLPNESRDDHEEGHHRVSYCLLTERIRGRGEMCSFYLSVTVISLTALNFHNFSSCQIYSQQVLTSKSLKKKERRKENQIILNLQWWFHPDWFIICGKYHKLFTTPDLSNNTAYKHHCFFWPCGCLCPSIIASSIWPAWGKIKTQSPKVWFLLNAHLLWTTVQLKVGN